MNNFLEIKSLRAWYGASQALFDVNLKIKEGEIVALLGRNGMGKSTTIKSICGLINNFQGEINFSNISLLGMPSYKIAQLGIGLVPEGRRAFSNLTVLENLIATSVEGEWTLEKVFETNIHIIDWNDFVYLMARGEFDKRKPYYYGKAGIQNTSPNILSINKFFDFKK